MRIVFATGNAGKLREIRSILKDTGIPVISMKDAGVTADIDENGTTFEENSVIKARTVRDLLDSAEDTIVMADDSGLEVDAMDKGPGVYSARFMGEDTSYEEKNAAIIKRLEGVPPERRTARFRCVISAIFPDGEILMTEGAIEGRIGYEPRGSNGFGYDPIFYLPDMSRTTAQLDPAEKDLISHRGKALTAMKEKIESRTNK